MDLKESQLLGDQVTSHWYYRAKAKALKKVLNYKKFESLLDVGAGSGFFTKYLLNKTSISNSVCVDIGYDLESKELSDEKQICYLKSVEHSDADLVLLMDVLEHVEDDYALLKNYVDKTNSGTTFVISVPAFQFMWSNHDVFLEHHRRYNIVELERLVTSTGLRIEKSCYFFSLVFPIAFAVRMLEKIFSKDKSPKSGLVKHSDIINTVLVSLCNIDLSFFKYNRFFGLTVFCVAKK